MTCPVSPIAAVALIYKRLHGTACWSDPVSLVSRTLMGADSATVARRDSSATHGLTIGKPNGISHYMGREPWDLPGNRVS